MLQHCLCFRVATKLTAVAHCWVVNSVPLAIWHLYTVRVSQAGRNAGGADSLPLAWLQPQDPKAALAQRTAVAPPVTCLWTQLSCCMTAFSWVWPRVGPTVLASAQTEPASLWLGVPGTPANHAPKHHQGPVMQVSHQSLINKRPMVPTTKQCTRKHRRLVQSTPQQPGYWVSVSPDKEASAERCCTSEWIRVRGVLSRWFAAAKHMHTVNNGKLTPAATEETAEKTLGCAKILVDLGPLGIGQTTARVSAITTHSTENE